MVSILLHSSKTMRRVAPGQTEASLPVYLQDAKSLVDYIMGCSVPQLGNIMQLSETMAQKTHTMYQQWSSDSQQQTPAIDAFIGDIYSGLQVHTLSQSDRAYAQQHLFILSGLYGILRALDGVSPYRLEMAYKLPSQTYKNLYTYWGSRLAPHVPAGYVFNLSSVEYSKALLPYLKDHTVISPHFMTKDSSGQPKFVTVHAKVARGAYAHWLITARVNDAAQLGAFDELGYSYDKTLSSPDRPVYVCETFGGLGLSVRLRK